MRNERNERPYTRRNRVSKIKIRISKRMCLLIGVVFAAILYVGVYRIFDIKYVSGKDYENRAIYNQINKIQDRIINPNRGAILDRNKQALAVSLNVYNVIFDIRNFDTLKANEKESVFDVLIKKLGMTKEELNELVKKDSSGKLVNDTNYKILKKEVEYKVGQEIKNQNLKCIYLEEDTKRIYPHNSLAAQTVGFIRGDSSWGLESYYNENMTGTPGRIFRTYEANNSIITRQEAAKEGNSIVTTIDQTIQQYVEKAIKDAYYQHNAENTSAIVMNPNTGEILAMASYPTFDSNSPNKLSLLEKDDYKKVWEQMPDEKKSEVSLKSWRNFNISDTFEPGSIFKPIVIAAALEEGVINESDTYFCGGKKVYGEDTIKCHKISGHGSQSVSQVLENSCNVGMMDIVTKLGAEKFLKYQRDFGYGEKTGIDLPGEASAENLMYSIDQLKGNVYLATSSFGQGFNATAMQSMNAFAATVNGGNIMQPYLVSQIIDKDGNVVEEHNPKIVRKVISQSTSDFIRKSLESVVNTGTGKKAKIDGYAIGGKTGTAEQGDRKLGQHTCSYIAYLPVENPDIMIGVFLHKPTPYIEGTSSAAPMLREILMNIINYKAIPPSYENNSNNSVALENTEILVGDYTNKNLQETVKNLNALGLNFDIVGGSGDTIVKQIPTANNKINKSTKILLYISTKDKSKELVLVPDVIGMTTEQAKQVIEQQGFLCNIVKREAVEGNLEAESGNEAETGGNEASENKELKVVEQCPSSEVKIEKGTIIKIVEG